MSDGLTPAQRYELSRKMLRLPISDEMYREHLLYVALVNERRRRKRRSMKRGGVSRHGIVMADLLEWGIE